MRGRMAADGGFATLVMARMLPSFSQMTVSGSP